MKIFLWGIGFDDWKKKSVFFVVSVMSIVLNMSVAITGFIGALVPVVRTFLLVCSSSEKVGGGMGFLKKIVETVAADEIIEALNIPIKALDKASKSLDEVSKKSEKKLFEKEPGTEILVINQHEYTWVDKFNVYDENNEVKYTVKGEFTSIKRHLNIYDTNGKKLGMVKEKLIAMRSPISFEANPVDFIIEIQGKKLGKVKSRWSFGKQKYEVDFNGWRIEGSVLGWKYKILNGDEEVAYVKQKVLYCGDTYVVTFPDINNELVLLMLVIALDAANAPKRSEEFKRTARRRL